MFGRLSHADGVCGDQVRDDGEQCDDGNLSNGDGCSNVCSLEHCGNGTVDVLEQCDDGNAVSGDGCSEICRIEFCGDTVVQTGIAEQCDDGNGLSGDGCSSLCKSETQFSPSSSSPSSAASSEASSQDSSASEASSSSENTHQAADEASSASAASAPIAPQATEAAKFFLSPESEDYKQYVNQGQQDQLLEIMHQIESGTPLTDQEKIWAKELLDTLTAAREAERARYTDLLKQFIATPISSDIVTEKNLTEQRLVDVAVPIAVDELRQAISVIERGELQSKVLSDLALLKRQGLDLTPELPSEFASSLAADARSINVFETLKTIKESTEKHATTNLPASLESIRTQVEAVRTMLPVFEREYGLKPETVSSLLDDIDAVSKSAGKQDAERVVAAVNRFLSVLERQNVIGSSELSVVEASHPAAGSALVPADADLTALAEKAPELYKDVFEKGSVEEQKASLLEFLSGNDRLSAILTSLPADQRQAFQSRFDLLKEHIGAVGSPQAVGTDTTCDDSMSEALSCTAAFLDDAQTAAREKSFVSNLIGTLQDYFGIGQ